MTSRSSRSRATNFTGSIARAPYRLRLLAVFSWQSLRVLRNGKMQAQAIPKQTGALAADPLDGCPTGGKLILEALETAVEMIDAMDHRLALRRQCGDDERYGSAQVGRHD